MYENNLGAHLDDALFKNPTSEYRGTPFWAWNCELDEKELLRQIEGLKSMGFGGFHMHVRTGMATTYLSDEHMALVKACVEKARSEKMLAWLYDEDRWPSGAAGGYVTKDPEYRARYLLVTPVSYAEDSSSASTDISTAVAVRTGNGSLVACYDVVLDDDGCLASAKRISENDPVTGVKWYCYLETPAPNPWYNNQTYANTLDKKTIDRFIDITYNAYLKTVGDDFGGVVPAMFTDEPQFSHKTTLKFARESADVILPWTDDLPDTFRAAYGADILDSLPELLWELPCGAISAARYRYHDHIAERFSSAFADSCGKWCADHNLMLTGHMMEEPTLGSQTAALGEAMRSYRSFGLPGIDMLCDSREFTTAKQAQSAAHQFGRPGVLSELYGVTNWDFDFRGHKLQGDWQAALGITVRVPHLAWVSMAGEAKRDYPASINYQSPWYKEYPYVEDHFARVNTAMTRGKADVRVGVIHPIESYWLHWGPSEQTSLVRDQMDRNFQNLTDWMLKGMIDFDFICESLLPIQCDKASAPLNVGEMSYDVIVVPACETLRSSTLERLEAFKAAGGRLLFMGEAPKYADAAPCSRGTTLFNACEHIAFDQCSILEALEPVRTVGVRNANGSMAANLIYQMRNDGNCKWLFIAHAVAAANKDIPASQDARISVKGSWIPTLYDTLSGDISPLACAYENGCTIIRRELFEHDSLLIRLLPGEASALTTAPSASLVRSLTLPARVPYTLSEPNVFLLDMAETRLDDGLWKPEEELLRADNAFRAELGWASRRDAVAQPWVVPNDAPTHTAHLRFTFNSEIAVAGASLAIEDAEKLTISLNAMPVPCEIVGYFTDKSIKTIRLPDIIAGTNVLEVSVPFSRRANIEWCYILGDFGVRLEGRDKCIVAKRDSLAFDDITRQGLPFYGANITYHAELSFGGDALIHIPHYRGALISVSIDGAPAGRIVYEPYSLRLSGLPDGNHFIDITAFGNRHNSFAPLHMSDASRFWFGPDGWRTDGDSWCYEYRVKPTGILSSPVVTSER